jgi:hypothetical protein
MVASLGFLISHCHHWQRNHHPPTYLLTVTGALPQFRVVDKDDPEARRTSLTPRPNVVVEKDEKISADINSNQPVSKQTDLYTEIMKLDDLRKKGLLTDAQFEVQKQKLLDRGN